MIYRVDLPAVLEYVSLFVDMLVKVIPGIKGARDKDKYASLGAELLMFYNDANAMVTDGYDLISALRTYVERMERHLATGKDRTALEAGHWMHARLVKQAVTLRELRFTFSQLWDQLSPLMDPLSFQECVLAMMTKLFMVEELTGFVETGQMPLGPGRGLDQMPELTRIKGENEQEIKDKAAMMLLRNHRYTLNFVPTNVPWEEDILHVVKECLEVRKPEQQLESISQGLELIRLAIIENFEIKDVLLKIPDARMAAKRDFVEW
jgi:hypothetical protein